MHVLLIEDDLLTASAIQEVLTREAITVEPVDTAEAGVQRAGLGDIRWILTAGGIIALHVGTKR